VREQVHPFTAGEKRHDAIRELLLCHLVEKLIEVTHRFGWIRSFGQEAGELLDHSDCRA
jgi:hypothetical protein